MIPAGIQGDREMRLSIDFGPVSAEQVDQLGALGGVVDVEMNVSGFRTDRSFGNVFEVGVVIGAGGLDQIGWTKGRVKDDGSAEPGAGATDQFVFPAAESLEQAGEDSGAVAVVLKKGCRNAAEHLGGDFVVEHFKRIQGVAVHRLKIRGIRQRGDEIDEAGKT